VYNSVYKGCIIWYNVPMKTLIVGLLFLGVAGQVSAQEYTFNSKASIEDYIWSRAVYYNYNPKRAVEIAKAESELAINAQNASSTASGLFQFINGTYEWYCVKGFNLADSMASKNDPFVQIECAVRMLADGGESHWDESRHVWEKRSILY